MYIVSVVNTTYTTYTTLHYTTPYYIITTKIYYIYGILYIILRITK